METIEGMDTFGFVRDEREKKERKERERESKLAESSSMNLNKNGRAGGGASEDCSRDGRSEKYVMYRCIHVSSFFLF